jgi:hypothetical protein
VGYDTAMLGTFNSWMLELPALLQLVVAFAVIGALGVIPLFMWLGYAVASTPDAGPGSRNRPPQATP